MEKREAYSESSEPRPTATGPRFSTLPLSKALIEVVAQLGYEAMTEIQAKSIPLLLKGKDVIGQSKTGSGKTAAFSLPILDRLNMNGGRRLQAVILSPTRELCTQVAREIRKLGRNHPGLQVLILSGGVPLYPQLASLEKSVHIIVGTPGRVIDHINRKTLDFSEVSTVVLDEADRMLDMGFQDDMQRILGQMPEKRQTVLFSATFPKGIESMSRAYQRSPTRVTVTEEKQAAPQIRQIWYEAEPEQKLKAMLWILQQNEFQSAIVFCNLKATVIELAEVLKDAGVSAAPLHGDLDQPERDRVMAKFRNRSTRLLIATDVAARGIDVEDLDLVCNFDLPQTNDVYVHRIGRTGRAGKKGLAISLVTARQKSRIPALEDETGMKLVQKTLTQVEHLEVDQLTQAIGQGADMETLYISGGRKDKVRPGDILGALTGEAGGLKGSDIGKIEIHDRFSYVALSKNVAHIALKKLNDGRIKGRKFRVQFVR